MILDEEVFAVILAISVVASAVGIAVVLTPEIPEPFMSLGLLNEECKIGRYPTMVQNGSFVELCIYVVNYMNKPVFYRVDYKLSEDGSLPTNTTPLPIEPISSWYGVLNNKENTTIPVKVFVATHKSRVVLVFELWVYDSTIRSWTYTGIWNHLRVNVTVRLIS